MLPVNMPPLPVGMPPLPPPCKMESSTQVSEKETDPLEVKPVTPPT
jgi:hypothetical protein